MGAASRIAFTVALFAVALALAATAAAQTANPVLDNYRAYRAALEANDLAGAEAAAAAALGASQARDGEAGRTGVLALNLAMVRLDRSEGAAAHDPAALAFAVAEALPDSGVDPLMARLALGESEMSTAPRNGRTRLLPALQEAEGRADLDERAFSAALSLARWANTEKDYDSGITAWHSAATHAQGAPYNPIVAHGIARTGEAAMIIKKDHGRENIDRITQAYGLLREAVRDLWPLAHAEQARETIGPTQRAYAQTLAWMSMTYAARRGPHDQQEDQPPSPEDVNTCGAHMEMNIRDWSRYYPPEALREGRQGVVVLRGVYDGAGHYRTELAASAPEDIFAAAAADIVSHMVVTRTPESPADCVMSPDRYFPVSFRID